MSGTMWRYVMWYKITKGIPRIARDYPYELAWARTCVAVDWGW